MPVLVGRKAPFFKASAVINGNKIISDFSLDQFMGKKYVILLFYPKDFTFVCPTELHAFQEKLEEFNAREVQLIAVSTDTEHSHLAWMQISRGKGGIEGITYPVVADTNKTISYNYGVLPGEWTYDENDQIQSEQELVAYRGLFLLDKEGIVRHQLVNDASIGRNVQEAIRVVDALKIFEAQGEVCPANWEKGKKSMKATREGLVDYLSKKG